jgi:hypothetical protein
VARNRPSEQAMKNIYSFIGRVLPKYLVQENSKADFKEVKSKEDINKELS